MHYPITFVCFLIIRPRDLSKHKFFSDTPSTLLPTQLKFKLHILDVVQDQSKILFFPIHFNLVSNALPICFILSSGCSCNHLITILKLHNQIMTSRFISKIPILLHAHNEILKNYGCLSYCNGVF